MVTVGFNLLFICLCVESLNCVLQLFQILGRKQSSGCTGKRLDPTNSPPQAGAGEIAMDAGMPHSTLHEQHWLIYFSLALGSGCLIKCKHLNDLSYSVDFLSIILAKLFALLTSWQAFQVI